MNNLISNFPQILEFARSAGIPEAKRRGIIREYLQAKFLSYLYARPLAKKLSFIGGTSLRILRGLPRFSEDLDFDNLGLDRHQLADLITDICNEFNREQIDTEMHMMVKGQVSYHELRFPKLLFDLKISTNPREKLMIKVDYSTSWTGQRPETVLLSAYGLTEQIVTNPLHQIIVQKLAAYVSRPKTQPRDMYDVIWLCSRGAKLDRVFMDKNRMPQLVEQAREKFEKEGVTSLMIRRLQPFLFDEGEVKKIRFFGETLKQMNGG